MNEYDFDQIFVLREVGDMVVQELEEEYLALLYFGLFGFVKKKVFKNKLSKDDYAIALANYLYFKAR